jgi:hypothetical protein
MSIIAIRTFVRNPNDLEQTQFAGADDDMSLMPNESDILSRNHALDLEYYPDGDIKRR